MAEMGYHLAFIAAKELLLLADPLSKDELESRGTSGPRHRGEEGKDSFKLAVDKVSVNHYQALGHSQGLGSL